MSQLLDVPIYVIIMIICRFGTRQMKVIEYPGLIESRLLWERAWKEGRMYKVYLSDVGWDLPGHYYAFQDIILIMN